MNKLRFISGKLAVLSCCLLLLSLVMTSCQKDEPEPVAENDKTLFVYMPWASNLLNNFYTNLSDLETSISRNGLKNQRVLVFLSTSAQKATLFEITSKEGISKRVTLKEYTDPPFTTASGITALLNDVKTAAPALTYSMIIGCHGVGWIPVSSMSTKAVSSFKFHWENEGALQTRFFGGLTSDYQTDITTLAEGIEKAGLKLEYLLFDDCYMSNIEIAYDLRKVTRYLIGSTSEIMAYGMPYATMGEYLLGEPDYEGICNDFYAFYSTYPIKPCGTLAVTDCSEVEALADVMKEINSRYTFDSSLASSLQRLDGYSPVIFYDFGDYAAHLCNDPQLLKKFEEQLQRTVPHQVHTEYYYSALTNNDYKINTFSGITVSDPSSNILTSSKTETGWYKATH